MQVFIAIILMLKWSTNLPEIKPRFEFLDLFAGCAQGYTTWLLACLPSLAHSIPSPPEGD